VAVLPFQDLGGEQETAYLSVAVPDEIISALSRIETLAVRPFAATARYTGDATDLAEVGAEVRAVNLVTGQYFREGERLRLTMEAVDVESGRLLWRESLAVPTDDVLDLRRQVAESVRGGLVGVLAPQSEATAGATLPTHPEAYELYLKSLSVQRSPEQNRAAIAMLERSVELDAGFARAWAALAQRLHYDAHYGGGGEPVYEREAVALERALTLDPYLLPAGLSRVIFLTDEGKLLEALDIADTLVERHSQSADAYFARSYVRRYASLVDQAIADCERALELDPTNYRWRSCANNFMLDGSYDGAAAFLDLDRGSDFSLDASGHLALSRGDAKEALRLWSRLPDDYGYAAEHRLLEAHLAGEPIGPRIEAFVSLMAGERDPESLYVGGILLVFVGAPEQGFDMVRRAIEGNYCSATGLENDRFWEPYRDRPEYQAVLRLGRACRERFARRQEPAG
jgi:TolB-like protein/Tfp pilus assembly protein PilF